MSGIQAKRKSQLCHIDTNDDLNNVNESIDYALHFYGEEIVDGINGYLGAVSENDYSTNVTEPDEQNQRNFLK